MVEQSSFIDAVLDHGVEALELAIGAALVALAIDVIRRRRRRRTLLGFVLLELMNNHDFLSGIPDVARSTIQRNPQGIPVLDAYVPGDVKLEAFGDAWSSDDVRILKSPLLASSLRHTYSGIAVLIRTQLEVGNELDREHPILAAATLMALAGQVPVSLATIRGTIDMLNAHGISIPST